jgi:CRP-like cAMP-binding protein
MNPSSLPLFEGLTGRQRDQALACFDEVTVLHGTPLIVEGDEDASLLCVVDGELEIRTGDTDLWTAGPGEIVGEIGLFTGGVRTANVETNTEATLLILGHDGYAELVDRQNPVAMKLELHALQTLVRRLRSIDQRIAKIAEGSVLVPQPPPGFFDRVKSLFGLGGSGRVAQVDVPAALAKARLFQGVGPEVLASVAPAFSVESHAPGSLLCREGEVGDRMYVLVSGLVDVLVATASGSDKDGRVEYVATLDSGDAFGMAGLVDHRPRTATCVVKEDALVLVLDRTSWVRVVERDEVAGRALRVAMIRSLAEQLAFANGQLALLELTGRAHDITPLFLATAGVEAQGRALGG